MKGYKVVPKCITEWIGEANTKLAKLDLSDCKFGNENAQEWVDKIESI